MSLVVFEGVGLSFGKKKIVADLNLRIGEQDRIGLIGPNGSGKSTILRVLSNQQAIDEGKVSTHRGLRLGYLPQDIYLQGGRTLLDFVKESVPGRERLENDLALTQAELDSGSQEAESDDVEVAERQMALAARIAELYEELEHFERHFSEHEALRILDGLGFKTSDSTRDLSEFSGGWKMRALLAALLFQQPDLLMLDEPTNHLDMPSVAWLSEFLKRYRRAFILICHDREFLNEQIERVVSFESEGVRSYRGNYDQYLRQRAEEEIVLENQARNLAKEREKAEQFIDRFRAQATKAKAVQSRVKALEKLDDVQTFEKRRVMRFDFPACERTGNEVIRVRGLAKSYGNNRLFSDLDLTVMRGQKIAIIGVNGAGKTTLLRIIAGELERDAGEVEFGSKVEIGYFAQHHSDTLPGSETVFDCVYQRDPLVGSSRVRSILGAFLFSGDDVDKRISVLSGGERARVALSRLLVHPGNVLLLDEPTNHLDLDSCESLVESLSGYDGTVLFVSHNRSFVRRLADQIWNVHDGVVDVYDGTFDEYLYSCQLRGWTDVPVAKPGQSQGGTQDAAADAARKAGGKDKRKADADIRRLRKERLGPLEKKISQLEGKIAVLEGEQAQRDALLADPQTYEDAAKRDPLLVAYKAATAQLETLQEAWLAAQDELETKRVEFDASLE